MCLGVGGRDRADVPALHVRYNRQGEVFGSVDQVLIDSHSGGAEPLEESSLKLYGGGVVLTASSIPVQNCRVASASGSTRSSFGKREGTGSMPATSTLSLRRAVSVSARIVVRGFGIRGKRKGARRRPRGPRNALSLLLDLVFQGVASGELGDLRGGDVDPLLGLRVDPLPGVALLHVELAEARDLDLLAVLEAVGDDLGERVEEPLGITLRGVCLVCDLLDQRRFV